MKTLNAETTKTQLNDCGVVVKDISVDLEKIVSATVASKYETAFTEAKVNAIRLALSAKEEDFTPKDIFLSASPLSYSIMVYNDKPYIVDYSDKKGIYLISMDGEEFETASIKFYPVIGTITI